MTVGEFFDREMTETGQVRLLIEDHKNEGMQSAQEMVIDKEDKEDSMLFSKIVVKQ